MISHVSRPEQQLILWRIGHLTLCDPHQYMTENNEAAPSVALVAAMGSKAEAEKVVVSTSMRQLLWDQARECDKEELTACKAITKDCDSAVRASLTSASVWRARSPARPTSPSPGLLTIQHHDL